MQKTYTLEDLESLATRLTDLPKFLGSSSKSKRKHGRKIWKTVILPSFEKAYINSWDNSGTDQLHTVVGFLGEYRSLITDAQYEKASEVAVDVLKYIREAVKAERGF